MEESIDSYSLNSNELFPFNLNSRNNNIEKDNQFFQDYKKSCIKMGLTNKFHLNSSLFLQNLNQNRLDVKCDRISSLEWNPVMFALKRNNSLKSIRFYCGKYLFLKLNSFFFYIKNQEIQE